jgi:hypothetical protein
VAPARSAGPPAWVTKRDGRREPFDPDEICQSLFAASEALGEPNAFLARELTDAVVHFLSNDPSEPTPTTAQIAEHVVKVVRELGQPALAQVCAQATCKTVAVTGSPPSVNFAFSIDAAPDAVARRCLEAYSERAVFSRDLVAAQADGLLLLAGKDTPRALARCVVELPHGPAAATELPGLCAVAGQGLVVDGPEWLLPEEPLLRKVAVERLVQIPALARRPIVVNVNAAQPPAWARQRGAEPLFAADAVVNEPEVDPILDAMRIAPASELRWDWHVQARDFAMTEARTRLQAAARLALDGAPVAFVFDRPRRPVALAEAIDRQHPAVLIEVGLNLEAFLRRPEIAGSSDAFRDKLPSLARMAVSAGAQKRKYLRRHAEASGLARGFLLDRARLAVVPLGLDRVVRSLTGRESLASERSLDALRHILQQLHDDLQAAGRAVHLEVSIDSPGPGLAAMLPVSALITAGPSAVDRQASAERQLAAASVLHAVARQGTMRMFLPSRATAAVDDLLEALYYAWRRTEVVRVLLAPGAEPYEQPALPG